MLLAPRRTSLIVETAKVISNGIRGGRWRGHLPSERILSTDLKVSRSTIRTALSVVEKEGLVSISHGSRTKISPISDHALPKESPKETIAILAPELLSKLHLFSALWVDELRMMLSQRGGTLTIYKSIHAFGKSPSTALRALTSRQPHSNWILFDSTPFMQRWFQENNTPAIIAGTRFPDIQIPSVDLDSRAVGLHAAHTLLGNGHRRIAILRPSRATAGDLAIEQEIETYLAKHSSDDARVLVKTCNRDVQSICRAIDALASSKHPPTVYICTRSPYVATVFTYLAKTGRRIPEDVSILSIEWEPFLDLVVPSIAHYTISTRIFAQHIDRIVASKRSKSEATYLTPVFVKGGSLAKIRADS